MEISLEISLYPLDRPYKDEIKAFIKRLKEYDGLKVVPNGLSTQVFGSYATIMKALDKELKPELQRKAGSVFILKLTGGKRDQSPDV